MLAEHVVEADSRGDRLVLRHASDLDALPIAEIEDGAQVGAADAMRRRAEPGVVGDAAAELERLVGGIEHFADELSLDDQGAFEALGEIAALDLHLIDHADDAGGAEIDRDQLADAPGIQSQMLGAARFGGDRRAGAVDGDHGAEDPLGRLLVDAPVCLGGRRNRSLFERRRRCGRSNGRRSGSNGGRSNGRSRGLQGGLRRRRRSRCGLRRRHRRRGRRSVRRGGAGERQRLAHGIRLRRPGDLGLGGLGPFRSGPVRRCRALIGRCGRDRRRLRTIHLELWLDQLIHRLPAPLGRDGKA